MNRSYPFDSSTPNKFGTGAIRSVLSDNQLLDETYTFTMLTGNTNHVFHVDHNLGSDYNIPQITNKSNLCFLEGKRRSESFGT
ncbi:hypothetical protein DVH26_21975 [Paenibacillus sp. H1-7]|nr:hypothetical protein DVH26_21975 [Paenibacillus sp. H1-7]